MKYGRHFMLSLACLGLTERAAAQPSTSHLAGSTRPVAFELAVGREFMTISGDRGAPAATAITASVTSGLEHIGGMRATAWYIRRSAPPGWEAYGTTRLLVLAVAAEVRLHLVPNRLVLSPMIGYGFSPYVAGKATTGDYPNNQMTSVKGTGKNWLGGVSLRTRHVFIEWVAIGLLGAEDIVYSSREYYPLSIGVRY